MNEEKIQSVLSELLSIYICDIADDFDYDSDIMLKPISLQSYSAASFFIDIENYFSIRLDELIPRLHIFTLKEISNSITQQLNVFQETILF